MTRRGNRGAKIVATLGPTSTSTETIEALVEAGLDVARLNFSHGDAASHRVLVERVRAAQRRSGRAIAMLGDLQGPKVRIGALDAPMRLEAGDTLTIVMPPAQPAPGQVASGYPALANEVEPGARIFLRDGEIELCVTAVDGGAVRTEVRTGGTLTSRAGMNLPDVTLGLPVLTDGDRADIRFAVEHGLDYLALSFVQRAADIELARKAVRALGADLPIIAKIETRRAVEDLDAIVAASDGVMVARGDLGVEVGPEEVPVWQRRIIRAAERALVPVIVATQMLESMTERRRPTRAEASDVANAVWDGADALMLSGETAAGAFPVEAVQMMDRIIRRAELDAETHRHEEAAWGSGTAANISKAARELVLHNEAIRAVVVFTIGGYSARLLAKGHPPAELLVLTPDPAVRQRLALMWGTRSILCEAVADEREMLAAVSAHARAELGCADGDLVAVVGSTPLGGGGPTNFLAVHTIGAERPGDAPPAGAGG